MNLQWSTMQSSFQGAFCLFFCHGRAVTGASQAKVPVSTAGQTSRGVTIISPSTAGGSAQKFQGNGVAGGPSVVPTAVVSAAHVQTSPQAKVLLQMTVNQARNAARTGKEETRQGTIGKRACLPNIRSLMADIEKNNCNIKIMNNRK